MNSRPALRRVLTFRDLLLYYIVTGFSLRWVATAAAAGPDRKSTRLNSSHVEISYAVFCLKKKKKKKQKMIYNKIKKNTQINKSQNLGPYVNERTLQKKYISLSELISNSHARKKVQHL